MISEKRQEELINLFYSESNDPITLEWRKDLTYEEKQLVDVWDAKNRSRLYNLLSQLDKKLNRKKEL